ncbi:MAG: rod shape-determining protein RodA [Pedosphaera sp.]|nr:rod shape-determining protein RodA [Pedosphaera sp.]
MFEANLNENRAALDKLQLVAIAGLMLIGAAFVYSATMAGTPVASGAWFERTWVRQLIWYGIGVGVASAVCLVDYHTLTRWAFVAYWTMILLLAAVLVFGTWRSGARRWFDLGFFSLQPSEFAKLAFIFAQAGFLSRPSDELRSPVNFWKAIGLMVLPFLLIMKEPDLGSALVFLPTGFAMMVVAGTPRRFLWRLLSVGGIIGAIFLADVLFVTHGKFRIPLQSYQRDRLLVYFGRDYTDFAQPNATSEDLKRLRKKQQDDSLQSHQALISVGSGGLLGKGWRQSEQIALGFLPRGAAHTDFIFSVIAEEKGFVGSATVVALYAVLLFTGLRIAGQARDRLGKVLAAGVVTLLFSHIFINIGMNIRLMPVTGIPLPLLSYGGSSVLGSLIAMGILQNVHLNRKGY